MSTDFVKQTLRENLARVLIPHVADGLWSIYDNAKVACERNKQIDQTLRTFQNLLTRVPQWTEDTLNAEVDRISTASKCDYIEDLLLGVFVSYIRAFASMQQLEDTHVDIDFNRPSVAKFLHTMYKSAARESWSNAYLFKTIGVSSEQQARNRRDIETILSNSMNEVIDSFIPWKEISKAYFHARAVPTAVPAAAGTLLPEAVKPSIKIEEDKNETVEFEEEEGEEEEDIPRVQLGEDVKLDLEEDVDDGASVSTEAELEQKASKDAISLNL
jgi:hypothetical protein